MEKLIQMCNIDGSVVTRGRITSQAASATANENEDMKMSFVEVGSIIGPSIESLKTHVRTYQDYLALENFITSSATNLKQKGNDDVPFSAKNDGSMYGWTKNTGNRIARPCLDLNIIQKFTIICTINIILMWNIL